MKRNVKKVSTVSGKVCYIEKNGKKYIAYRSMLDILSNRPSPNINTQYTQKEMLRAYRIGLLNKTY